ncbi:MAG: metallophosphoesterase family protein [Natronomonas sp.]
MPTVAIVSDTHLYHDAPESIPEWVVGRIGTADHVIHAGDFVTGATQSYFERLADDLVAVRGNADVSDVNLPEVATLEVDGVTFGVTHPMGIGDASVDPGAYEAAVLDPIRERAGPDVIAVAGHTHRVIDTVVDGVRLLNPGSVTGALPADRATMLLVTVDGGDVDVTVIGPDGPE